MPRRMSCSMTVPAVRDRTKTVTRRHVDTWRDLAPGDRVVLIEKGMGLPNINPVTDEYDGWEGGCECGAEPEGHDTDPINAVKRWHRQHKAQIRGEVAS